APQTAGHRFAKSLVMTVAEGLAEWAIALSVDDVPEEVFADVKLHLLDTLGRGLAATGLGVSTEGRATALELRGAQEATMIGAPGRVPAPNAALANGTLCGAAVAPAAVAAGEAAEANGAELLVALAAGLEVAARTEVPAAGAAVSAAWLGGLDVERT